MKFLICFTTLLCLLTTTPCSAKGLRTLTTESYVVVITINCSEGTVVCSDIDYVATNRKTGESKHLHGRDMIHYCPEDQGDGAGKTPCRHEGYVFKDGAITYLVFDRGVLEIFAYTGKRSPDGSRPRKRLLHESGAWSDI